MSETLTELSGNPGRILKAAREEAGMSLVQAAEALHLRGSVVDAIEREDYATFSSPIFLKGYFRSYCRLLTLHEERMLALLEKQLVSHYGAMDEAKNEQLKVEQAQVRQRMLKKLGLFLVLLLVPVTLLFFTTFTLNRNDAPTQQETDSPAVPAQTEGAQTEAKDAATEPADTLAAAVPEQEFAYSGDADDQGHAAQATDAATVADAEPRAEGDIADTATTQAPVQTSDAPVSPQSARAPQSTRSPQSARAQEMPVEAVTNAVPTVPGSKALNFTFAEDCWLKLTDGKGKVLVAELKYSGDTYTVSAVAPLTLVLGNARGVTLSVDNQPYDLLKHTTQNGRVALVIK